MLIQLARLHVIERNRVSSNVNDRVTVVTFHLKTTQVLGQQNVVEDQLVVPWSEVSDRRIHSSGIEDKLIVAVHADQGLVPLGWYQRIVLWTAGEGGIALLTDHQLRSIWCL